MQQIESQDAEIPIDQQGKPQATLLAIECQKHVPKISLAETRRQLLFRQEETAVNP